MSDRTNFCRVRGDNCPCQAAQGDIPRFTFPPTTLNSATTVACVKLTARKDEGQLEDSEDRLLPVIGSLGMEFMWISLDIVDHYPRLGTLSGVAAHGPSTHSPRTWSAEHSGLLGHL